MRFFPSTYSIAMKDVPVSTSSPTSWIVTMFGWESVPAACASRRKRSVNSRVLRVVLAAGPDRLQRDAAADDRVAPEEDDSHRALSQLAFHLVAREFSGQRWTVPVRAADDLRACARSRRRSGGIPGIPKF